MAVLVIENPTYDSGPIKPHVFADATGWIVTDGDHLEVLGVGSAVATFARGLWRTVELIQPETPQVDTDA